MSKIINENELANRLKIDRKTLYNKLDEYRLLVGEQSIIS